MFPDNDSSLFKLRNFVKYQQTLLRANLIFSGLFFLIWYKFILLLEIEIKTIGESIVLEKNAPVRFNDGYAEQTDLQNMR